jgi:soluble lytic murein transglycosylase-like protein
MQRIAILIALCLVALAPLSRAQTLDGYFTLRDQHGVTAAAGVEALETLVGTKVLEVRGIVKGSFRVGDRSAVMLEQTDGGTIVVDADAIPNWLLGNEIVARLLVRAHRPDDSASLRAVLLGAAPDGQVRQREEQIEAKRRQEAEQRARQQQLQQLQQQQRANTTASRSAPTRTPAQVLPASEVVPIYAAFIKRQNSRLTNADAMHIAQGIVGYSLRYGVDARLIMAMVMVESGFNPEAVSRAGAMGLGQLMPGTARELRVADPFDPHQNLYGSIKLIRQHLDRYQASTGKEYEGLVLSLAAYNAGPGAVRRHGGVPPFRETQNYVRKVIGIYMRLSGQA